MTDDSGAAITDLSDRRVTIWSDYLCPYCWIARGRARWIEGLGVEVEWLPYELHPEVPAEGIDRELLSAGRDPATRSAHGRRLRSLAGEESVDLDYPDVVANTRLALEAAEWARSGSEGDFDRFHDAVFRAYWEDGRNIGLVDELAGIAGTASLDPVGLTEALAEGAMRRGVESARAKATEVGATGTPAFLISRGDAEFLVPGLQSEEFFMRVLSRIGSR